LIIALLLAACDMGDPCLDEECQDIDTDTLELGLVPTFGNEAPVILAGNYTGDVEEPFVSRDGASSMDSYGRLFYTDTSHLTTLSTINLTRPNAQPQPVPGSLPQLSTNTTYGWEATPQGWRFSQFKITNFNMDAEVTPMGDGLYVSRATTLTNETHGGTVYVGSDIYLARMCHVDVVNDIFGYCPYSWDMTLANVNTPDKMEYAAGISADRLELYFVRAPNSLESSEIWVARRPNPYVAFSPPTKVAGIAPGFVEGPTLTPDGRTLIYHRDIGGHRALFAVTR
jgi:hypothetical protein